MDTTTETDPAAAFALRLRELIDHAEPPASVRMVAVYLHGRVRPIRQLLGEQDGLTERQSEILAALKPMGRRPLIGKHIAKLVDSTYDGNFREDLAQLKLFGRIERCPAGYRLPTAA